MISCRAALWACCVALVAAPSAVAGPPPGFELRTIVTGLDAPTAMAYAADGRIFIAEKSGLVRVFDQGRLHTFVDLRDEVNQHSDRGLNNLVIDDRGRVFLFFTTELRPDDPDKGHPAGGTLIRIEAMRDDPNRADAKSRTTLISGFDSRGPWHSIGGLDFDPDGNLVVGFGDGSPYFPKEFSPAGFVVYALTSPSGKILRIDPETGNGVPQNPLYVAARADEIRSKIIASGFRMPYRLTVDPADGAIYVGDVGTDQWEEIDVIAPASTGSESVPNYGWPCYEGGGDGTPQKRYIEEPYCVSRYYAAENAQELTTPPAYAYDAEGGAAVVLGPLGSSDGFPPQYDDRLFFADFIRDRFWTYDDGGVSDFGEPGKWGGATDIELTPGETLAYTALLTGQVNEIAYVGGEESGASLRDLTVQWVGYAVGLIGVITAFVIWRRSRVRS